MGIFTPLKKNGQKFVLDLFYLFYTPVSQVVKMASGLLSRPFHTGKVSHAVSLLLRLQMISCVILNVGAVWFKCKGECSVSVV